MRVDIDFETGEIKELNEEDYYRAEMTRLQFAALSDKLNLQNIVPEIQLLAYFNTEIKATKNINIDEVKKWLINSWNTENVLSKNHTIIKDSDSSFAMQWAFPQAYYSIFCSLLAYFKSVGHPETAHIAVMKKFADLVTRNKFPQSISFYCTGTKKNYTFTNIEKPLFCRSSVDETTENQICQFLKSTRIKKLDEKKGDTTWVRQKKLTTKKGQPLKNFKEEHWQIVSDSLWNTTIMDCLYRKRIMGNYGNIDTFLTEHFAGSEVLNCLCSIVFSMNFTTEIYIAKTISIQKYDNILTEYDKKVKNECVIKRFCEIQKLLK